LSSLEVDADVALVRVFDGVGARLGPGNAGRLPPDAQAFLGLPRQQGVRDGHAEAVRDYVSHRAHQVSPTSLVEMEVNRRRSLDGACCRQRTKLDEHLLEQMRAAVVWPH